VLEEGSSKVWREGWQTDKQPGAEPKEEALNGGEETRGTKRDSTGKKLDNDEQLDEREGDRTEQESSRQLTYKQARRHPHAHYDGQIHINEHAQAHIHIHTHTHLRHETGDQGEEEFLTNGCMQSQEGAAVSRRPLLGARVRSDSSEPQERPGGRRRINHEAPMDCTRGDRSEGRDGCDHGENHDEAAGDAEGAGPSSKSRSSSSGRSRSSSSSERGKRGARSNSKNGKPIASFCEPSATLRGGKKEGGEAAARMGQAALEAAGADLAPADERGTASAVPRIRRAAESELLVIARSQRCNIEASDVLRAENDAGRRERDADEIDDALNNDNEGSRNQSCSNNNNNNNNIKSSKRNNNSRTNNNNNNNSNITQTSNNGNESEGATAHDMKDDNNNNNSNNNSYNKGDDEDGDDLEKGGHREPAESRGQQSRAAGGVRARREEGAARFEASGRERNGAGAGGSAQSSEATHWMERHPQEDEKREETKWPEGREGGKRKAEERQARVVEVTREGLRRGGRLRKVCSRSGTLNGCDAREVEDTLCSTGCSCGRGIPSGKVKSFQGACLHKASSTVFAAEAIREGEYITCFGQSATVRGRAGNEFNDMHKRQFDSSGPKFQYSYCHNFPGVTEQIWVIPQQDVRLALQLQPSPHLVDALKYKGPEGVGHLVNHTCCKIHVNAELRLQWETEAQDKAVVMVCAMRAIAPGEEIKVHYTPSGEADTWASIFKCSCCKCRGACRQNRKSASDFAASLRTTRLSHEEERQLEVQKIEPGVRVQVHRAERTDSEDHGNVNTIMAGWASVRYFSVTENRLTSESVPLENCNIIEDNLYLDGEDIPRASVRRVRWQPAPSNRSDYLDGDTVGALMRWAVFGATDTAGLQASNAKAYITTVYGFQAIRQCVEQLQSTGKSGAQALIALNEKLGGMSEVKSLPAHQQMFDHIFIPIHLKGADHWISVHIQPNQKRMRLLDSLHKLGKSAVAMVLALTWVWLRSSHGRQKEGDAQGDVPIWDINLVTADVDDLAMLPGFDAESRKKLKQWQQDETRSWCRAQCMLGQESLQLLSSLGIRLSMQDGNDSNWKWTPRSPSFPQQAWGRGDCGMFTVLYALCIVRGWDVHEIASWDLQGVRSMFVKALLEGGDWSRKLDCLQCGNTVQVQEDERSWNGSRPMCCTECEGKESKSTAYHGRLRKRAIGLDAEDDQVRAGPGKGKDPIEDGMDPAQAEPKTEAVPKEPVGDIEPRSAMMIGIAGRVLACGAERETATEWVQQGDDEGNQTKRTEVDGTRIVKERRKRDKRAEGSASDDDHEQGNGQERDESEGMNERGRTRWRRRHDPPREEKNRGRGRRNVTKPRGTKGVVKGDGRRQSTLEQCLGLHHSSTAQESSEVVEEPSAPSTDEKGREDEQQNTKRSRGDERKASPAASRVVQCGGIRTPAFTVITSEAGVHVTGPKLNARPRPTRVSAAEKCTGCGALGAVSSCSKCKIAHYCDKRCQKKDWPNHKKHCTPACKHEKCDESSGPDDGERNDAETGRDESCEESMATARGPQTSKARAAGFLMQSAHEGKQSDRTRHERRAPGNVLDSRAEENSQDLQRESEHRDALITLLDDARTDGRSAKSNNMDRNAVHHDHWLNRIERLKVAAQQARVKMHQDDGELEKRVVDADKWVEEVFRPWAANARYERYEKLREEWHLGEEAHARFQGIPADNEQQAIALLRATGIDATDENWDKAQFEVRRMRSGKRAASEMTVRVVMNEALFKACAEQYKLGGQEVTCDLDRSTDDGQDSNHITAALHPVGTEAGSRWEQWMQVWKHTGITETEVREVILLNVQVQMPEWGANALQVWSPNSPRAVSGVWEGNGAAQGQLRITGKPIPGQDRNTHNLQAAWAVAGRESFEARQPGAKDMYPKGATRAVKSVKIELTLPRRIPREARQSAPANTAAMLEGAPSWLQQCSMHTRWEPLVESDRQERGSSICIRMVQTKGTFRDRGGRDRHSVRQEAVNMLNDIQARCGLGNPDFKIEEVNFTGFLNARGALEGMITVEKRAKELFTADTLAGVILAFCIGNRVQQAADMRWCPAVGLRGESACSITGITAACTWAGLPRRDIVFGHQVAGYRAWYITNDREATVRRILAVLCKGGSKEDLLSRLKVRPWERKRSVMMQSLANKYGVVRGGQDHQSDKEVSGKSTNSERRVEKAQRLPTQREWWRSTSICPRGSQRDGSATTLTQQKSENLYLNGDWAGASAVTGDWSQRQAGTSYGGTWAGAEAVARAWEAMEKGTMDSFLQELRENGHVGLANAGVALFLEGQGKKRGAETKEAEGNKAGWMQWLEGECRYERKQVGGNIASWNVGPEGYERSKEQIIHTLKKGHAIVMLQEMSFPPGAKRRVKRELEKACPEYLVFLESSVDRTSPESGVSAEYSECHPGWHNGKNLAVATCLHRGVFKSARRVEWDTGAPKKKLKHMARGRVLWVEAVTRENQVLRVINLHQATSGHLDLQEYVQQTLKSGITKEHGLSRATIMGGDLNADPTGHRKGYAVSNAAHLAKVDSALSDFIETTKATLVSPETVSWRNIMAKKEAKLDHLLVWNLPIEKSSMGRADWVGSTRHDHARITFRVAELMLPPRNAAVTHTAGKRKFKLDEWKDAAPEIQVKIEAEVAALHEEVKAGRMDVGEAMENAMSKRDQVMTDIYSVKKCPRAHGRHPNRCHEQIIAFRELAQAKAALAAAPASNRITAAQEEVLRSIDISDGTELSQGEKILLAASRPWKELLRARISTRENTIARLTERQVNDSRREADRQARREFLEEHKGPSKFAGKRGGICRPERLWWAVPNGLQVICERDNESKDAWEKRAANIRLKCKDTTVSIEQGEVCVAILPIKPHCDSQAVLCVQTAVASWRRSAASQNEEEFIRRIALEMKHHSLGEEDSHLPEEVLNRVANEMWTESVKDCPGGGIGSDGVRGRQEFRWTAAGPKARREMEEWIHHLRGEAKEKDLSYDVQVGQENGRIRVKSITPGRSWIIDRETGGVELSGVWEVTEQVKSRAHRQKHADGEGCPFGTETFLGQARDEDSMGGVTSMTVVTITTQSLTEMQDILAESQKWTFATSKRVLTHEGPWIGSNMTIAWELYFQEQGLSPHAKCTNEKCRGGTPLVICTRHEDGCNKTSKAKRQLEGFCERCWRITDLRQGSEVVGDMGFMSNEGVFDEALKEGTHARLRGELTDNEFRKYVDSCLKCNKSTGPDGHSNESIRTMSEMELNLLKTWANKILTTDKGSFRMMTIREMSGVISLLHKGGETADRPSDWRPVVLLNSTNQLIMHILNSRLRNIVERAGLIEPGQAGGRQGRSTDINMSRLSWVTREAQAQGKKVYRVDVDFKNAFNALNQAALWSVMKNLNIPDVDLLQSIYERSTVRMPIPKEKEGSMSKTGATGAEGAPTASQADQEEGATISFDTGVAQGSALSPLLFIIFMNALLRLLTAKGKKHGIWHGLAGADAFNNMGFVDDLSLFANSIEGAQTLLGAIEEFEEWSGLKVNRKKTCIMVIDGTKKTPVEVPRVFYQKSLVRVLPEGEACRYLGLWGTAKGDMAETKRRVVEKTKEALELMRHHPLTEKLAVSLFTSVGVGAFRYSAALVPWTLKELNHLESIWSQAYKLAATLPVSAASDFFVLPSSHGGLGKTTPLEIMTQELCRHLQRCMKHDDVVQQLTQQELERAKQQWACNSLDDLQQEMEVWSWDQTLQNKWARASKCLQLLDMRVDWGEKANEDAQESTSWAEATRELRRLRCRLEAVGGKQFHWDTGTWHMERDQWNLVWEGEKRFWQIVPRLLERGLGSVQEAQQEAYGARGGASIPRLMRQDENSGEHYKQFFRVLLPQRIPGVSDKILGTVQRWLDMADWRMSKIRSCSSKQKSNITHYFGKIARAEIKEGHPAGRWVEEQERIEAQGTWNKTPVETREVAAKLEAAVNLETEDQRREVLEQVVNELNPGYRPIQSIRCLARILWGGRVSDTASDQVARAIGRRLPPGWKKEGKIGDHSEVKAMTSTERREQVTTFLNRKENEGGGCQTKKELKCEKCGATRGQRCSHTDTTCEICDEEWEGTSDMTRGEDRSRRKRRQASAEAGRKRLINIQELGKKFIERVLAVRWKQGVAEETTDGEAHLEFKVEVTGWEEGERSNRRAALLDMTDIGLRSALRHRGDLIFIPGDMWPEFTPKFGMNGWWYTAKEEVLRRQCKRCMEWQPWSDFAPTEFSLKIPATCKKCSTQRKSIGRKNKHSSQGPSAVRELPKRKCRKMEREGYMESSDGQEDETPVSIMAQHDIVFSTADPRYIGQPDNVNGGDITLTVHEVRRILECETDRHRQPRCMWLTSRQMGWSLTQEEDEVADASGREEDAPTRRCLAPAISAFIRPACASETWEEGVQEDTALRAAWELDLIWGQWASDDEPTNEGMQRQQQDTDKAGLQVVGATMKSHAIKWESRSTPLVANDPALLLDNGIQTRLGQDFFLDEEIPRHGSNTGYVSVTAKSIRWQTKQNSSIFTLQGLTTCFDINHGWTIMSGTWNHLRQRKGGTEEDLMSFIKKEVEYQGKIEATGYCSPTWRLQRALRGLLNGTCLLGESAVTAPPFFDGASRGASPFWGTAKGPTVILWDSLDEEGRKRSETIIRERRDWVVWARTRQEKNDKTIRGFEQRSKVVFVGSARERNQNGQGDATSGEGAGKPTRKKGWWRRGDITTKDAVRSMSCWTHEEAEIRDEAVRNVAATWECEDSKDECVAQLEGNEEFFWSGSEVGMLGGYGFHGVTFGGDGANEKGSMGAGCCCLQDPSVERRAKVGRAEEGCSSSRPEGGALLLALRATRAEDDLLYLGDNESVLTDINKWVGEGSKATLANAPNADILSEIIEKLRERIERGSATFLVKVKSHRGDPLNERADTLADEGRLIEDKKARWTERTRRLVFSSREEGDSRSSTWTQGVRKWIRTQAGKAVCRRVYDQAERNWRRRIWKPGKQEWMQPSKLGRESIRRGAFKVKEVWGPKCLKDLEGLAERDNPATNTWCADFVMRSGQSQEYRGEWLNNPSRPSWRRRLMQMTLGIFPCGKWLHKTKQIASGKCNMCRQALEERATNGRNVSEEEVPDQTIGHISSAGCWGQRAAVTAAHHNCFDALMADVTKHVGKESSRVFTTLDTEMTLATLWDHEGLEAVCSKEELWKEASIVERSIPLKETIENEGEREEKYQRRFWARRPDGIVVDKKKEICYILEFKRKMDRRMGYREEAADRATNQYASLMHGLKGASKWTVHLVILVGGMCGSVHTETFNKNMELLGVIESKWNEIRRQHVFKLMEEQDRVLRSFFAQKKGGGTSDRPTGRGGEAEHLGRDVYA